MGSRYSRGGPASRELLRGGCIWIRAPHVSSEIERVVEVVIDLRNVRRGHQDPRPPIQPPATGRFSVVGPSSLRFRKIAANISELLRAPKEPPFPRLSLLIGCRWITQFIDLLGRQIGRFRYDFSAGPRRRLGSC